MNFSIGLPRFSRDSGSLERFVEDFDIFARFQRWKDDRKTDVFPMCPSGIVRDAYDALRADQKTNYDLVVAGLNPITGGGGGGGRIAPRCFF